MGLMDSLKKATGIGLTANEHYDRAYEKGVLLGPANYAKAVDLFETAAKKAAETGDTQTQTRARANAALYSFISTGNEAALDTLRAVLPSMQNIEQIGVRTETIPAGPLLAEVEARITEIALARAPKGDARALARAHAACADAFRKLSTAPLITYKYQGGDRHREQASSRFFYHQGMTSWNEAVAVAAENPETAAEHMARALNAYRQCGDADHAANAQTWLTNCRLKRTCWMCGREFQGANLHFRTFQSSITPYAESVVRQLGQDVSMIDVQNNSLTLCEPCGATLEHVADQFAVRRVQELRDEVESRFSDVCAALSALANRIDRVESLAHRHS